MKWQLQTAKAKLSELIRRVDAEGPQTISVRGAKEYVVLPRETYDELAANDAKPRSALDLFRPILGLGIELDLPSRDAEPERPNPFDDPDHDDER